jgi:putative transposase
MHRRSGSHAELFYHFVWSTKRRSPLIDAEIENSVKAVFLAKAEELEIEIVETNGTENHIHMLVKSKPAVAPADIAKNMKGASSHFVNHVVLGQDRIRSLYWQDGYGVVSVSPGAVHSVQQYIRNQKEHHASNKLIDDLEVSSDSGEQEIRQS